MEIRANSPDAAYVDTSIPKVAETPLEGCDASAPETFGPFDSDSDTVIKTPNSKGYTVRFEGEEPPVDPIERAIDSIFLFIDDVREASSTARCDGERDGEEGGGTLDCMAEGLCRNPCVDPCVESFGQMQPPVDLMLNVQEEPASVEEDLREEPEVHVEAPKVASPPVVKKPDIAVLSKENSVKDFSAPPVEARESAPAVDTGAAVPTYSPVESIADKVRTLIPEETLQMVMDAFILETGEVRPDVAEMSVKNGVDEDPLVEAIDRLIMFFDDLHNALMTKKVDLIVAKMTQDLQAALEMKRFSIMSTKEEETTVDSENDRSDNSTVSADTVIITNTKKTKPASLQMAPEEYAEAVAAAAELLSQSAPPQGSTKEELHKQALERIMAERSELEEGLEEYKTEEMILDDLLKDAEQAIMASRSMEKEGHLVVLGHSATLTPIPEADEASAGTPSSDMIEQGVMNGTIPEVPLLPTVPTDRTHQSTGGVEETKSGEPPFVAAPAKAAAAPVKAEPGAVSVAPAEAPAAIEGAPDLNPTEGTEPTQQMVKEDFDPIIYAIDNLFMCYDDIQEQKHCEGCLGASVPSDIMDGSDEIVEREVDEQASLEPRLNELEQPHDTRGQAMLQEALKLVQEASGTSGGLRSSDSRSVDPTSDIVEKLAHTFDDAIESKRSTQESLQQKKKIYTAGGIEMEDTENNRAIAQLVDAAFEESDKLRKVWKAAVDHPGPSGKERDPAMATPQMSLDMDSEKQQTKVEFEMPEMMEQNQDPYIAWAGDDSELMASINADRKLSELEHENIFRDVSKGLQESSGGIITRADNQDVFSIYNAPAFTEGNSSSAELLDDRFENPARAALKVLCAESISVGESESSADAKGQQTVVACSSGDAARAREMGKKFAGWSLSKKREEMLRTKMASQSSM